MAATAMILMPGETLGGYRILEMLGIGGMAIVYRAEQLSLGREVALKVMRSRTSHDANFVRWFRREGRSLAKLDHPHIVAVYDSGEADGQLYLAMRLVSGVTLAERIEARGLTADQTLEVIEPIADGLQAAHRAGLIHRDVKPQNILISGDGHPYLADFGIAKGVTTAGWTDTHRFVGTYSYAAPEQSTASPVTPATDVYALTAVLFHCFTGRPPFSGENGAEILFAKLSDRCPAVDPRQPGGEAFNSLVRQGMAQRPDDRFESVGELACAAREFVELLPAPCRRASPAINDDPSPVGERLSTAVDVAVIETVTSASDGHESHSSTSPQIGTAATLPSGGAKTRPTKPGRRLVLWVCGLLTVFVVGAAVAALAALAREAARSSGAVRCERIPVQDHLREAVETVTWKSRALRRWSAPSWGDRGACPDPACVL